MSLAPRGLRLRYTLRLSKYLARKELFEVIGCLAKPGGVIARRAKQAMVAPGAQQPPNLACAVIVVDRKRVLARAALAQGASAILRFQKKLVLAPRQTEYEQAPSFLVVRALARAAIGSPTFAALSGCEGGEPPKILAARAPLSALGRVLGAPPDRHARCLPPGDLRDPAPPLTLGLSLCCGVFNRAAARDAVLTAAYAEFLLSAAAHTPL